MRQKKNDQINQLMKDSSDEEGDIRGWIKGVAEDENNESN